MIENGGKICEMQAIDTAFATGELALVQCDHETLNSQMGLIPFHHSWIMDTITCMV